MASSRLEIEAKARVDDPNLVLPAIQRLGREIDPVDYKDSYYVPAEVEGFTFQRFRVRQSGGKTVVTAKELVMGAGGESSREWEFEVSDAEIFVGFMRMFGFKRLMTKSKRGRRFTVADQAGGPEAVIELVEIGGLGWFVEIEVMVDQEDEVAEARRRVEAIFAELGLGPERMEPRAYTAMLYDGRG